MEPQSLCDCIRATPVNPDKCGGMGAANQNTRRESVIKARCSKGELDAIRARAAHAGLNASDFIRRAALGHGVEIIHYERLHPADLAQMKRLGNLLNQIARAIHRGRQFKGTADHLDSVLGQIGHLIKHQLSKWGAL